MSKKSKYGNIDQDDLLRYMHGELSDEERHAMERELQKDLFASDALEGLSTQRIEQVREDLDRLEGRLKKRVKNRQSAMWIRIAASVAILLAIGTVYFTVFKDMSWRTDRMAVETESKEDTRQKGDQNGSSLPLQVSEDDKIEAEIVDDREKSEINPQDQVPEERGMARVNPGAAEQAGRDEREAEVIIREETILADEVAESEALGAGAIDDPVTPVRDTLQFIETEADYDQDLIAEEIITEPEEESLEEFALEMQDSQSRARGSDMARATAMEGAEAARPSAAQPPVSAKKQANSVSGPELPVAEIITDSVSALPAGGMDAFRAYLGNNMVVPETPAGSKTDVILSFSIGASGKPQNIEIVETAGESFSREAIRLLQDGPDWTITSITGVPVQEKVRLRINFPGQ